MCLCVSLYKVILYEIECSTVASPPHPGAASDGRERESESEMVRVHMCYLYIVILYSNLL